MSVKHKVIFLQKDGVFILLQKSGNSNSMSFDWLKTSYGQCNTSLSGMLVQSGN